MSSIDFINVQMSNNLEKNHQKQDYAFSFQNTPPASCRTPGLAKRTWPSPCRIAVQWSILRNNKTTSEYKARLWIRTLCPCCDQIQSDANDKIFFVIKSECRWKIDIWHEETRDDQTWDQYAKNSSFCTKNLLGVWLSVLDVLHWRQNYRGHIFNRIQDWVNRAALVNETVLVNWKDLQKLQKLICRTSWCSSSPTSTQFSAPMLLAWIKNHNNGSRERYWIGVRGIGWFLPRARRIL